jgi:uncharacterized membrane protein
LFRPVGVVIIFAGIMILVFRQQKQNTKQLSEIQTLQSTLPLDTENNYFVPGILLVITGTALTYRKKNSKYRFG